MNDFVIAKYIRLSRDEAVSESNSIPNQHLLLNEYIEELDIPNATILEFVDNGYTGTSLERPGFQEMIELVRCGRINCIITKDFSRFARNELESGYYIEQVFPLYRVRFIAIGDDFDSKDHADGTGGIAAAFKFLKDEYYSKDLSKKVKAAMRLRMEKGEHITANAIYGYRKNNNGKWEHDPTAAEVVRKIFNMALDGKTTAQIRDKLFADHHLAPREYAHLNKGKDITPKYIWATRQIWRILNNEQYAGTYIAGKGEVAGVGSKACIEKDRSEWIIIPNSHPPIVSKEDFVRVQEILKSPKDALPKARVRSINAKKYLDSIESGERKLTATLFGYGINSSGKFEIDNTAAKSVKAIFDLALQGYTIRGIAEKLQEEGYLPPKEYSMLAKRLDNELDRQQDNRLDKSFGNIMDRISDNGLDELLENGLYKISDNRLGKEPDTQITYRWPPFRVRKILQNEQYTGAYVAGKRFYDENGQRYHVPQSEWIVIPNKHPAIISKEIFEQVQAMRSQGKRKM